MDVFQIPLTDCQHIDMSAILILHRIVVENNKGVHLLFQLEGAFLEIPVGIGHDGVNQLQGQFTLSCQGLDLFDIGAGGYGVTGKDCKMLRRGNQPV